MLDHDSRELHARPLEGLAHGTLAATAAFTLATILSLEVGDSLGPGGWEWGTPVRPVGQS